MLWHFFVVDITCATVAIAAANSDTDEDTDDIADVGPLEEPEQEES